MLPIESIHARRTYTVPYMNCMSLFASVGLVLLCPGKFDFRTRRDKSIGISSHLINTNIVISNQFYKLISKRVFGLRVKVMLLTEITTGTSMT